MDSIDLPKYFYKEVVNNDYFFVYKKATVCCIVDNKQVVFKVYIGKRWLYQIESLFLVKGLLKNGCYKYEMLS